MFYIFYPVACVSALSVSLNMVSSVEEFGCFGGGEFCLFLCVCVILVQCILWSN